MTTSQSITLSVGDLALELCPEGGGSITRLTWQRGERRIELMSPGTQQDVDQALAGDPRGMSNFPLVPYCGRIDHGHFVFEGRTIEQAPNFAPEPHAIHGDGWKDAWQIEAQTNNSLELSFDHSGEEHALRYSARQIFTLSPDGMNVVMSITNTGNGPMPAAIGMHPAFVRTPKAHLQANVGKVWMCDDLLIPQELTDVPDAWDFTQGRTLTSVVIDNNFPVWDGRATITWPEFDAQLEMIASEEMQHFVVFSPPDGDLFCVEPVSCTADGFNLAARGVENTGMRTLAPGETFQGSARFNVTINNL